MIQIDVDAYLVVATLNMCYVLEAGKVLSIECVVDCRMELTQSVGANNEVSFILEDLEHPRDVYRHLHHLLSQAVFGVSPSQLLSSRRLAAGN